MDIAGIRLTALSSCAGCAAKLGAAELRAVLAQIPAPPYDENVLVGYESGDDAGLYALNDRVALIQTVDFFTPIVDDPFDFGRIAATNALSDVYAMGGRPITALNIVAFPEDLDLAILARILEGGAAVARDAGVAILGGHTIKDSEPKYGMAVTGLVERGSYTSNAAAQPGNVLVLTKPLGTGVLTTARKRDAISDDDLAEAIAWMTMRNEKASRVLRDCAASAVTDVTGFGLLGHAGSVAEASGVSLEIDAAAVPCMKGTLDLIRAGIVPSGTRHNAESHAAFTTFAAGVDQAVRIALSDAQTSGGLLAAIPDSSLESFVSNLRSDAGIAAVIGRVRTGSGISIL